jgi:hypothetical protein
MTTQGIGLLTDHNESGHHMLQGFRLDQISIAFDRVRDHQDWKAPIRATVQHTDRKLVDTAIQWFTGTTAEFSPVPGSPDLLLVTAPGHRLGPAGHPDELPRRFTRVVSENPHSVEQGASLDPQS